MSTTKGNAIWRNGTGSTFNNFFLTGWTEKRDNCLKNIKRKFQKGRLMIIFLYRPFWSLSKRTQILISIFVEEHATQREAWLVSKNEPNKIFSFFYLSHFFVGWHELLKTPVSFNFKSERPHGRTKKIRLKYAKRDRRRMESHWLGIVLMLLLLFLLLFPTKLWNRFKLELNCQLVQSQQLKQPASLTA